jgi:phosphohistidine phosphatase SixA
MIVFALRHADRTASDDLSGPGRQRAKLLARMLAESGISVAFRSHFCRAVKTLDPLQAKLPSLQVKEIRFDDADEPNDYAKRVATAVQALPPSTVVAVIGHSDTVGPTIMDLGGKAIDPIEDSEFDRLFVMFISPNGAVSLLKLRYGEPT